MPPHPPPRQRSGSSRNRLLDAAKRLFAEQGYEQTATSAIAREARTSESQLMRYFGGKVGLLEALFDDAWEHLNGRIEKVLQTMTDQPEAILDAVQALVTMLARDADLATLLMFEGRRMRGSAPRIRVARGFVTFTERIHGLVRSAQAAGHIDPTRDTAAVTSALLGAAESLIRDRLVAKSASSRTFAEREIRHTLAGMMGGLRRARPAARVRAKRR